MNESAHIVWHASSVTKLQRQQRNGHRSGVLWFTGLSGSGKSTLANALDVRLQQLGVQSYVLDGDNIRHGLNRGLGFSVEHRQENIRRIAEVSKLFVDAGMIVMTAFISPFRADRQAARTVIGEQEFIEVSVQCQMAECERRDPKGLYAKARRGEIKDFTGISSPYEAPEHPDLIVRTDEQTVAQTVEQVIAHLRDKGWIPTP